MAIILVIILLNILVIFLITILIILSIIFLIIILITILVTTTISIKPRLTPLHHIAMRGNRDLMQLLLTEQLDLNARDLQVNLMLKMTKATVTSVR